jgi:hypothetical protein
MTTVTLDILDDKAWDLLKDMEVQKIIRIHFAKNDYDAAKIARIKSYQGLMTKQPIEEIDKQIENMRNEWD